MATHDTFNHFQGLIGTGSNTFKDLCDPVYLGQSLLYYSTIYESAVWPTIWAKQKMDRIYGTVQVTNVKIYHSTQNLYAPPKLLDIQWKSELSITGRQIDRGFESQHMTNIFQQRIPTHQDSWREQGKFVTRMKKSRCLQRCDGLTSQQCTLATHEVQSDFICWRSTRKLLRQQQAPTLCQKDSPIVYTTVGLEIILVCK